MTSPTGYTRSPGFSASQQQIASILSVDLVNLIAVGYTRQNTTVNIDFSYHVGAVHVVPAVGDQWTIKRFSTNWVLVSQLPYQPTSTELDTITDAPAQGIVQIGNTNPAGTGGLYLNGASVNVNAPLSLQSAPTDTQPAADTVTPGSIIYDSTLAAPVFSNGTTWESLAGGGGGGGGPVAWSDLTGIPTTFPPAVPISWTDLSGIPATFPPTPPVGTPDGTKFWSDQDTWAVPPGTGGGGITIVTGETPTGTVDGITTVFTTASAYASDSTMVYLNGIRMERGVDYTETSGHTLTFTTIPQTGDDLQVDYVLSGSGGALIAGEIPSGTKNGINVTFTLANSYLTASTSVFRNGLREQLGVGYTEAGGNTITFTTAPLSSDVITVDYQT